MSTTESQVRKWFWPWQDEAEERWLEQMAKKGLHFEKVTRYGLYTFCEGSPTDMVYRLDYQNTPDAELGDYFQLFVDAGWEYAGEINSWRYFRKVQAGDETSEIFTDNRSKIEKYQRALVIYLIAFCLQVVCVLELMPQMPRFSVDPGGIFFFGLSVLIALVCVAFVITVFTILNLVLRIQKLKEPVA
ncbi:MAG: DUF2812 domain-containing protein [Anaerolineaceae bacterium]|nr:DUF2812 domain-containing protein [Anaerolineaceae bacterium]